jgi:hypothetical protein
MVSYLYTASREPINGNPIFELEPVSNIVRNNKATVTYDV